MWRGYVIYHSTQRRTSWKGPFLLFSVSRPLQTKLINHFIVRLALSGGTKLDIDLSCDLSGPARPGRPGGRALRPFFGSLHAISDAIQAAAAAITQEE